MHPSCIISLPARLQRLVLPVVLAAVLVGNKLITATGRTLRGGHRDAFTSRPFLNLMQDEVPGLSYYIFRFSKITLSLAEEVVDPNNNNNIR